MRRFPFRVPLALFVLSFAALPVAAGVGGEWRPVRGGSAYNLSGLALVAHDTDQTQYLAVHDNKRPDQGRAGLVTARGQDAPTYEAVSWRGGEPPADLEAVCAVPDAPGEFVALASAGTAYHVRLDAAAKSLNVLKAFPLPDVLPGSNFEGVALQRLGGRLLLAWAHRGQDGENATLHRGLFDAKTYRITDVDRDFFRVPWPTEAVRHVSDLRVDAAGVIFVTAARDPGDDGPFESALYVAGAFDVRAGRAAYAPAPALTRLKTVRYHKVEALELVPGPTGGVALASDDENLGGSLLQDW